MWALGPDDIAVAQPVIILAEVHEASGRHVEARDGLLRAIEIAELAGGVDHPQAAVAAEHLATVLLQLGEHEAAQQAAQRALDTRTVRAVMPTAIASAQFTLAQTLQAHPAKKADRARARELGTQALEIYAAAGAPFEARTAQVRRWLLELPLAVGSGS